MRWPATNACAGLRTPGEQADVPDHAAIPAGQPADQADQPAEVSDPEQAELQRQVQAVLAELEPDEREVIELSLRHDLYDSDLATALGVSWSQAYALTSRARSHLEKDLGALLTARTRRKDCPALGALPADWDGQLTGQTRELVGEHIEQCAICAAHRRSAVRPAALSALLADLQPLAIPPAGLRDEVMKLCSPTTPETPMYRRSAEQVRPTSFSEAITVMRWGSIRSNPGAAIAALAVVLWLVAVVSVLLLTLAGSHSAQALPAEPSVSAPATSPAAATTRASVPAATHASASARPSRTASLRSADPGLAAGRSAPPPAAPGSRGRRSPRRPRRRSLRRPRRRRHPRRHRRPRHLRRLRRRPRHPPRPRLQNQPDRRPLQDDPPTFLSSTSWQARVRSFRVATVLGWSEPSSRSRAARVCSSNGIASAARPAS